jgi:hypothetical protein
MEAILVFWPRTLKITQIWPGGGGGCGGEGIVQSEAGIAAVAGIPEGGEGEDGGGGWRGSTNPGQRGGEREHLSLLLYFPFHFSFASFWLAVRLFLDKNEIDRIPTRNFIDCNALWSRLTEKRAKGFSCWLGCPSCWARG